MKGLFCCIDYSHSVGKRYSSPLIPALPPDVLAVWQRQRPKSIDYYAVFAINIIRTFLSFSRQNLLKQRVDHIKFVLLLFTRWTRN